MDIEYRRKERKKERWKKEQKTERVMNKSWSTKSSFSLMNAVTFISVQNTYIYRKNTEVCQLSTLPTWFVLILYGLI